MGGRGHPSPPPRRGRESVASGGTGTFRAHSERVRVSIELGDVDLMFPQDRSAPAWVYQRLFALGYLCQDPAQLSPTAGAPSTTIGELAWAYFKDVNHQSSDDAAKTELQRQVRETLLGADPLPVGSAARAAGGTPATDALGGPIAPAKRLPAAGEFGRIRVPGAYLVTDADGDRVMFRSTPRGPAWRNDVEAALLAANSGVGFFPVVVKVAIETGDGQWRAVDARAVSLQVVAPDVPATGAHALIQSKVRSRPQPVTRVPARQGHPWSPADYLRDWIGHYFPPRAGDVQATNMAATLGGKRGLPVVGPVRARNTFYAPPPPPDPAAPPPPAPRPPIPAAPPALPAYLTDRQYTAVDDTTVSATTNAQGEAVFVFMPSTIAGDRYKLRAFVPPLTDEGSAAPPIEAVTGTLTVWRALRLEAWHRWDYPAGTSQAQRDNCGGALDAVDVASIAATLAQYFIEVLSSASSFATPTPVDAAKRTRALAHAKAVYATLGANYPAEYQLRRLAGSATAGPLTGLTAAELATLSANLDRMFPSTVGGAGFVGIDMNRCKQLLASTFSWDLATIDTNDNFWGRLMQILYPLFAGVFDFFSRTTPGSVAIVQMPAHNTKQADHVRDDANGYLTQTGLSGLRRGVIVAGGHGNYFGSNGRRLRAHDQTDNTLHELGHLFYLHHDDGPGAVTPMPGEHDGRDTCIMSYTRTIPDTAPSDAGYVIDFCGRCILHLIGCDTVPVLADRFGHGLRTTVVVGTVLPPNADTNPGANLVRMSSGGTATCFSNAESNFPNVTPLDLSAAAGTTVAIRGLSEEGESLLYECVQLTRLSGQMVVGPGARLTNRLTSVVDLATNQPIAGEVTLLEEYHREGGTASRNFQFHHTGVQHVVGVLSGSQMTETRDAPNPMWRYDPMRDP